MTKRKPLNQKAKEFLAGDKAQRPAQPVAQNVEQKRKRNDAQRTESSTSLIDEILPESGTKEGTTRFCVDLPNSLAERLAALSRERGVPKTEIVRRLLAKALGES